MKSIHIETSDLKGVDVISSGEWDGEIIRLSRETFNKYSERDFLNRVGVYIIYADHYDKQVSGNEIYVGQGDDIRQRLKEHINTKPYWNKVLIFTSEKMNIAIAFNIEKNFILRAKTANKYSVKNGDNGQTKKLGSDDTKYLDTYINNALLALNLADIDIFTVNMDGVYTTRRYFHVKLVRGTTDKLTVLKGSKYPLMRYGKNDLESQNLEQVTKIDNGYIVFLKDLDVEIKNHNIFDGAISVWGFKNNCGLSLFHVMKSIEVD